MPTISIHPALLADISAVQALFGAYGSHLQRGLANICIQNLDLEIATLPAPYLTILLAKVDGGPAGCVALKSLTRPGEQACEIKRLYVADGYRGLGLGRRLAVAAIDHARQTGHTAVYLDTVPAAMPQANRLYETLGFEPCDRYNTNSVVDVVFYRRSL